MSPDGGATRFGVLDSDIFERMSGIDTLSALLRGELPQPPIAEVMNIRLVRAEIGLAVFEGEALEAHRNPAGVIHGGWAATILDSALGCATHSTLVAGERYTTIEMKVSYFRPVIAGKTGPLVCEGRIVNRGRTLSVSEARLVDAQGKLYAHGTETCMIFPRS
ncbi:MAG: PaaI family thioesterase [Proteobacteria bacterium]|nr:PaaI family thioesterase [Pseudomonadota bacterium]